MTNTNSTVNFMYALENYDLTLWLKAEFTEGSYIVQHMTTKMKGVTPYRFFFELGYYYQCSLIDHINKNYLAYERLKFIDFKAEQDAKELLESKGYYADILWSIEDVQDIYNCTDAEAYKVLEKAMTAERTVTEIIASIDLYASEMGLECAD